MTAEFISKVDGRFQASVQETCINDGTGGQLFVCPFISKLT